MPPFRIYIFTIILIDSVTDSPYLEEWIVSEPDSFGAVYKPLKQTSRFYRSVKQGKTNFRLLILHASEDREKRIHCSLRHASIEEETKFTALSYTWGDASATRYILLDGKSFLVTENLYIALQYLRKDMQGRSHQVQIMRQIYENAEDTWIWLGAEADSSDKAFDLLNLLSLVFQDHCNRPEEQKKQAVLLAPPAKWNVEDRIIAIGSLSKRAWWYRVWVIQELTLSQRPTVHCGTRSLPWATISQGIECLAHQQLLSIDSIVPGDLSEYIAGFLRVLNLNYLRVESMRGIRRPSLLYVLSQHRRSEASDPRDKCIALAGLAKGDDFLSRMEPYNESIAAIYTSAVKAIASWEDAFPLDFLICAGRPRRRNDLPSWCTGWKWKHPLVNCIPTSGEIQIQSSFSFPDTSPNIPPHLAAKGVFFDTIDGLGVPWNSQEDDLEETFLGRSATYLWTLMQPTTTINQYPGRSKLPEALWRTLLINRTKDLPSESTPEHYGSILAHLLLHPKYATDSREITECFDKNKTFEICGQTVESIVRQITNSRPTERRYSHADTQHVKILFNTATSLRRLATTRKGCIALAPLDAQRGDIITLLYGCSVPVVIRTNVGPHTFIGACYVHDIMNGEFIDGRERYSEETFVIT
ncbi:uncharacterized protein PAC_18892 [Phialocephala subalpina]|uniref:Heterokaryon incompatibility domain-containing protein n=1 Tax=Phialocephala subalpina TaxID=576137 RepID=A0A1L7XVD0_9HELO|nr:uncharacterized protein PAC_18892 [Phialocephala subalpina]